MKKLKIINSLLYFCFLLTLAGCGGRSPQAEYYMLSSIEEMVEKPEETVRNHDVAIGIGPVKFPDELDRSAIVTRAGANRLEVNELHRWGGSLQENFSRIMVENLVFLLKTNRVMARPWERYFRPDYRITIHVLEFSGAIGGHAELRAMWMIFNDKKDVPVFIKRSTIEEPVTDSSYAAFVAAQSKAVAGLCREIAAALEELVKQE